MSTGERARRRATITDVARAAGASRTSTSRALTGRGYTSPELMARIQAAADQLGHVPDALARSMKRQWTSVIGLLVSDLANPFYAELASGGSAAARARGYQIMLADTHREHTLELDAARNMLSQRVAGLIVTPITSKPVELAQRLGTPAVEIDRAVSDVDTVVVENEDGARQATRHLIDLGHTRIALVTDGTEWTTCRLRRDGYLQAHDDAGLEPDHALMVTAGSNDVEAREAMTGLLALPDRPTAVFTANSLLARGAWHAIRDAGLSIPEDVSLVAFDDSSWMSMVVPQVTTVRQDAWLIGDSAVRRLIDRIDDPDLPSEQVVLPVELILRGSTGRHPACAESASRPWARFPDQPLTEPDAMPSMK